MIRSLGPCRTCHGTGTRTTRVEEAFGRWTTTTRSCPACHGSGKAWIHVPESDPRMAIAWVASALLVGLGIALFVVYTFLAPPVAKSADQVGTATGALRGVATWYDAPTRRDAAAGPALRDALGSDWRGRWVTVSAAGRSTLVRLTDWCACGDRHGSPTVLDLDDAAFARLAPLGTGVLDVVVSWESGPAPTLPPTDIDEPPPGTVGIAEGPGSRYAWLALIAVVLAPALHLVRRRNRS